MPQGVVPVQPYRPGGLYSALNVTAAAVVKASAGLIYRITINTAGSAGTLTINDAATTGAAAAGNVVYNAAFGALTPAQQQGLSNLVYAMINDQRMRYAVSDIAGTHVPSGNGYLPGMQAIGMYGITMFTAVSGFSIYGSWGATQSVMQTVSNLSTAPGKYAGTLDYAFNTP